MNIEPDDPRVEAVLDDITILTKELATMLVTRLGESPEAIRGARDVIAMLGKLVESGAERGEDPHLILAVVVSALSSCICALDQMP